MAGAVNVSVVTLLSLILNVSGVDCDTTLSLLRSLIDLIVSFELSSALKGQPLCDSCSSSGLAVVNVTDGADVYVGLISSLIGDIWCPPLGGERRNFSNNIVTSFREKIK